MNSRAFKTDNTIAIIKLNSSIFKNFYIVNFAANIRIFYGHLTLSVNLVHKKCTELRIFEADAKICIILYACKIITNLLNRSIQKYLEFQGKRVYHGFMIHPF